MWNAEIRRDTQRYAEQSNTLNVTIQHINRLYSIRSHNLKVYADARRCTVHFYFSKAS